MYKRIERLKMTKFESLSDLEVYIHLAEAAAIAQAM